MLTLAEPGNLVPNERLAEQAEGAFILDVVLESQLCAGKRTDSTTCFADGGKAARDRFLEICRDELVSNLGWSRGDEV